MSTSEKKSLSAARSASISRETKETEIKIKINLDKPAAYTNSTTIPFMDHLLDLFAKHANISLDVSAKGDLAHHIIEDIGISLGKCIDEALGKKIGIRRYGNKTIPMDESLVLCALDLGGRPYSVIDLHSNSENVEGVAVENIVHFFESVAIHAKMNLHIKVFYGMNEHHKVEGAIKAFARAFREAIEIISDQLPSTKGTL